jgi:hypothetical protein
MAPFHAAVQSVIPSVENLIGKRLNNRLEYSHLPTRRSERKYQHFKSLKSAHRLFADPRCCLQPRQHTTVSDIAKNDEAVSGMDISGMEKNRRSRMSRQRALCDRHR